MSSSFFVLKCLIVGIGVTNGFVANQNSVYQTALFSIPAEGTDTRTGKRTGTSFLPSEAIERASKGSPIEKVKLEKDGTSAFVDVYEYAAKIRSGTMTWEEVEKADLDTVSRFS